MLVLLLLSLLLQLCYLAVPALHHLISPVFVALLLGLLAAFLLPLFSIQPRQLLASKLETLAVWQQKALRFGIILFAGLDDLSFFQIFVAAHLFNISKYISSIVFYRAYLRPYLL